MYPVSLMLFCDPREYNVCGHSSSCSAEDTRSFDVRSLPCQQLRSVCGKMTKKYKDFKNDKEDGSDKKDGDKGTSSISSAYVAIS